jgi:hypothetical protein
MSRSNWGERLRFLIRKPTLARGLTRRGLFASIVGVISIVCLLSAGHALAAKPQLSATFGVAGHQVNVAGSLSKGTVKNAPPPRAWRAALEEQVGGKWLSRASAKLHLPQSRSFSLSWVAPASQTSARMRVRVRAGRQTIKAGQAHQVVFSGPGNTFDTGALSGTTPPLETTPRPPQVTAISTDEVLNLPSEGDKTLVLAGSLSLSPGDFLTAPPGTNVPSGFLLKVLGSTVTGGQTHVQTESASLFEAVPNGSIGADLGNLASATPLNADARIFSRALRAAAASGDTNVPFDQHVSCGGSAEMNLSGSLDASLVPHLDLQWHKHFGIPTGIDHASATVDANLSADAQAGVSAAASCELEEVTLLDPKWTVPIEVGPVLVPVTIDVPIKASASASASGSIQVSADANMQGSLGIQYDKGDVSGIKTLAKNASVTHAVETQAELQARIGPGIGIEAGWNVPVLGDLVATAGVDVSSGLKLTYDPGQSPPGKLCVPLNAEGHMSLKIPGAPDLDAGPLILYDENIWCEWIGAVLLHWQGKVDFDHHEQYESDGWSNVYDATETWNVNGYLLEGRQDGFFRLPYNGTWHFTIEGSRPCSGGGAETATLVGNGSGSADENDTSNNFGFYSALAGNAEDPSSYIYPAGPRGSVNESETLCDGSTHSGSHPVLSPGFGRGGCQSNAGPLAHDGARVQGSTDCGFPGVTQGSWDLTVTCPDGAAPDTDWLCKPS